MVKKRNKEVIKGYFTVVQGRHQASQVALVVKNPMDRGAWWATVHGTTKSRTWLEWLSTQGGQHASLDHQTSSYLVWASSLTRLLFHLLHDQLWVLFLQSTGSHWKQVEFPRMQTLRYEGGGELGRALGIMTFEREKEGDGTGQRKNFNSRVRSSEAGMILQSCSQLEWEMRAFIPPQ